MLGGKNMSIGANTRKLRTNAGLTLNDLAEKVGIGKSMLCQLERGTKTMSLPIAVEISRVLNCSLYDLVGEEETKCHTT